MRLCLSGTLVALALTLGNGAPAQAPPTDGRPGDPPLDQDVTQGALRVVGKDGALVECPLKHTDVQVEVSGFIARVKVVQTFSNPFPEKIEAVYVFPLPHGSAVDDMTLVTGDRRIVGLIKRRAEARRIYEEAVLAGRTAALLEEERPNIFTQSVGNIHPGKEVRVEIAYIDVLRYDQGGYEFHFPMVVGPRYIPGAPVSARPPVPPELAGKVADPGASGGARAPEGTGWSPDTTDVPGASRITPPVLKPGFRTGHDISLSLSLDAGVPVHDFRSLNHRAVVREDGASRASARLAAEDSIPNKDFVLRYSVRGKKPEMAVLCHTDGSTGYFLLMVQPREDEELAKSPPREMVFMVDVSGSMSGQPIAKCREAMQGFLEMVREKDTIQVITFQSQAQKLFERPVPATRENIRTALGFSQRLAGGGGTEMLKGVQMAIGEPIDRERVRIVVMLTDGFIGNEPQIIEAVGKGCGDQIRFWCLGIGTSVNRFLVDGVARQGGGMGKVLSLNEDSAPAVKEFMERIQRAQLAKVKVDWGELKASDVYPARIPELWAGRPVVLFGLYPLSAGGKTHRITVRGLAEGVPVSWPLDVTLPARAEESLALSRVWAREKIEEILQQDFYAGSPEVEDEVTAIALEYRLMSPFTSFVAVDESEIPALAGPARPPRRMPVPVPMPEGVSYEGVFGAECEDLEGAVPAPSQEAAPAGRRASGGFGGTLNRRGATSFLEDKMSGQSFRFKRSEALSRGVVVSRAAAGPAAPAAALGLERLMAPAEVSRARTPARRSAVEEREVKLLAEGLAEGKAPDSASAASLTEVQKGLPRILESAAALRKAAPALLDVRARYAQAAIIDRALRDAGLSDGAALERAIEAIDEVNAELWKAWKKDLPALGTKLDLVIRDASIEDALAAVSRAAGLRLQALEGSIEDARALLGRRDVRVSFLDLRGATAAEALDWILRPARLSWQVVPADPAPIVLWGSDRRNPRVESAWVYDVRDVAVPLPEEREKGLAPAEDFLAAVRKALGLGPDGAFWFGPGRLAIIGGTKVHGAAASLFRDLAVPGASVAKDLEELGRRASARAEKRKEAAARVLLEREEAEAVSQIASHIWPLLARAAAGKLDDEAITEIEIAWRSAAIEKPARASRLEAILPRAAWAVREAARALPGEPRLAALAAKVLERARPAAEARLADLRKDPANEDVWVGVLECALAFEEDGDFVRRAREALFPPGAGGLASGGIRAILGSLLDPAAGPAAVASAFGTRNAGRGGEALMGEDRVVLAALACRRAGGEAWESFRSQARDILGGQPLPGGVVLLVSRQ